MLVPFEHYLNMREKYFAASDNMENIQSAHDELFMDVALIKKIKPNIFISTIGY